MEDDGTVVISIVYDGTTGVGVNRHNKVLDACLDPLVPDIKATQRHQSSRRTDHCGLVVDVSGPAAPYWCGKRTGRRKLAKCMKEATSSVRAK